MLYLASVPLSFSCFTKTTEGHMTNIGSGCAGVGTNLSNPFVMTSLLNVVLQGY